ERFGRVGHLVDDLDPQLGGALDDPLSVLRLDFGCGDDRAHGPAFPRLVSCDRGQAIASRASSNASSVSSTSASVCAAERYQLPPGMPRTPRSWRASTSRIDASESTAKVSANVSTGRSTPSCTLNDAGTPWT